MVNIRNKKAYYEYEILEKFVAGIVLQGTEIKSIRQGKASIKEGFCYFKDGELFLKDANISEYKQGNIYNHEPTRERKLLLKKRELKGLLKKLKDVGLSIVPLHMFISKRGFAKIEIGLAKGKKVYDKRNTIKDKDIKRDLERNM
jgi:SsrA-binding protein